MTLVRTAASLTAVATMSLTGVFVAGGVAAAQPCSGGFGMPGEDLDHFAGLDHSGADQQGELPHMPAEKPTQTVAWLTGPQSPNDTHNRFGITGTDLGIMWDNEEFGEARQLLVAFGDTVGDCRHHDGEWRSNTLLRSTDTDLTNGITFLEPEFGNPQAGAPVLPDRPNFARQVIDSLGIAGVEITIIPTAAVAVNGKQYVSFMSVQDWSANGKWVTNFSAIAVSDDNGETWEPVPETLRLSSDANLDPAISIPQLNPGHENFQMQAYAKGDFYVYGFGTPPGRFGAAHVSRVLAPDILDLDSYQYWNGSEWADDPSHAAPVIPAPVSELSVQWNDYLGQYIAMYADEPAGEIMLRTADRPEGPWSDATTLIESGDISGLYAPYIHPWSTGNELYFAISRWSDYNVLLMKTDLNALKQPVETGPPTEPVVESVSGDDVLRSVSLD